MNLPPDKLPMPKLEKTTIYLDEKMRVTTKEKAKYIKIIDGDKVVFGLKANG